MWKTLTHSFNTPFSNWSKTVSRRLPYEAIVVLLSKLKSKVTCATLPLMYPQRWLYTMRPGFSSGFMPWRVIERMTSGSRQSSGQSSLVVAIVFTFKYYSKNSAKRRYNQIKKTHIGLCIAVLLALVNVTWRTNKSQLLLKVDTVTIEKSCAWMTLMHLSPISTATTPLYKCWKSAS